LFGRGATGRASGRASHVDGKWVVVRQLGGDDIGQGEILTLRPNTVLRVVVYRYE